jgi:hypothetical protein
MTTESIVTKIKKLLALSRDNANEHEAAAAAGKAQALLFEHNLSVADVTVDLDHDPIEKAEQILKATRTTISWKRALYHAIAEHNFCQVCYMPGTTKVDIVGKQSNIEVVNYLYAFLEREILRLAQEAAQSQLTRKASYVNSFCYGAVCVVNARLREERKRSEATHAESKALVVQMDALVVSAFKQHFPSVVSTRASAPSNGLGYHAGREAGRGINIRQGVAGNQSSRTALA